ncbi:MAG: aminopeptidase P family protein [Caldilineae bacterium]|nr:aminopeptidase P family protein [Chloroflexota bacterium]MCB9177606.1 aminopeptidase P family protein [Caldilineae bacterium]
MRQPSARVDALRQQLADKSLDAIVISSGSNRRWLTGFTGSAGSVVLGTSTAHLISDSRYYEQVERQAPDFELVRAGYQTNQTLNTLLTALGARRVGFEAEHLSVAQLEGLRKALPDIDWQATDGLVTRLRAIKDADEIAIIRRAVRLADQAMEHAYAIARPGMTELELAWQLEVFLRERGAESLAFDTIVAAGENGALPHHHPSDRPIAAGEPIVIDMGARVDGYCSDLTRTFSIGPATDPDYAAVWQIVSAANRAAEAGLRAGLTGPEGDALARDPITEAGYGDHFGHSLGHGVGLDVHELPRLSQLAGDAPLEPGMVVTVEPGIYLPGRFGVRIEDMVLIGPDGAEVLSGVAREPSLVPSAV